VQSPALQALPLRTMPQGSRRDELETLKERMYHGEEHEMHSPSAQKEMEARTSDEAMALQLQQFIDAWHYRVMNSSLGRHANRHKVLETALLVLAECGVTLEDWEIQKLAKKDERLMLDVVVEKMPTDVRMSFPEVAEELMDYINSVSNLRTAVDSGKAEELSEILEERENIVVADRILRNTVSYAAKQVGHLHRCQATWVSNMETRLDRLMNSAEVSEKAQRDLMAVEAQLDSFAGKQLDKSKKVLMAFAEGNKETLMHTAFSAWHGLWRINVEEQQMRKRFEEEIANAEKKLYRMQEKQMDNVRAVLLNQAEGGKRVLLEHHFEFWKREASMAKAERAAQESFEQLEVKLGQCTKAQVDTAKGVMARMGMDQDDALLSIVFGAWLKFSADYKKDKEFEDAVKRSEDQLKEHMDKKKEEAKAVLDRLTDSTDSGLLASFLAAWHSYVIEGKKLNALERQMEEAGNKFKSLKMRQRGTASNVQDRSNELAKMNLLLRVISAWHIESKVNRIDKYYTHKVDSKRKQLSAVQTLFKSFARDLEEGLKHVEGDSSGRGSVRRSQARQGMSRDGGSVSLPDIHARH